MDFVVLSDDSMHTSHTRGKACMTGRFKSVPIGDSGISEKKMNGALELLLLPCGPVSIVSEVNIKNNQRHS